MRPDVVVTSDNFLVSTKPGDFTDRQARSYAASHAARFGSRKDFKPAKDRSDKLRKGYVKWRFRPASQSHPPKRPMTCDKAKCEQQSQADARRIVAEVPKSLRARPSLQNFFQANPSFFYPAQIILDAGTPAAAAFFPTIDLKNVYPAIMGIILSWYANQFPTQYPLSTALFYQAQALPILRERLSQGIYDEETHLIILCALQTAALLGDKKALLAHESGLEHFSRATSTSLSEYCRSVKPKHSLLVDEATGRSNSTTRQHLSRIEPRLPLSPPRPNDIGELLLSLPPGFQEMIYEHDFFNLDIIRFWVFAYSRADRIESNSTSRPKSPDLDFEVPIYDLIADLRRILSILEPESTSLKRFVCMANYLYLLGKYYFKVLQKARVFQELRNEATDFIYGYQPRSLIDRNFFVYNSLMIIDSWKNGTVLEREGVLLVASLKLRFPELQEWRVVRHIVRTKFRHLEQIMAEWEHSWSQSPPG